MVVDEQPALLGKALLDLLAKRDVADAMGQRGRKLVAEQYSLETMVSRYEAVWQQEIAVAG